MKKINYFFKIKKMLTLCTILTTLAMLLTACASSTETTPTRIGSLKGATSIGLLFLMEESNSAESNSAESDKDVSDKDVTASAYTFTMATQADELLPLMVKGELDIALVPANVASVLYHKMDGQLAVIDINTLGVLYMVTGDSSIQNVQDLKGRTIYLTGKGTTPDYVLHYILSENGMTESDYTLEYKSEATEVAALLAEKPEAVGLLPQPFVTAACAQNDALKVVLDMNEEWTKLQGEGGSRMVTGVTVVRKEFLEEHESAVTAFLKDHAESAAAINADPATGASLAVEAGIVAKEPIAEKAIPACNITCIQGEEMKQALSGYLEVLFDRNPESVGGALPGEDFYYVP